MATETQTKILEIQVNYEKAIKGIADYEAKIREARIAQDELRAALKAGEITTEEYDKAMAASKIAIGQLRNEQGALTKQVQQSVKAQNACEDSLVQLRARLSNLTAEYDALSGEMRKGEVGKALQDEINAVTDQLKGAEEDTQRYYRNVGNYENSVRAALAGMNEEIKKAQDAYDEAVKEQGEMSDAAQDAKEKLDGLKNVMDFTTQTTNKLYSSILPFGDKVLPLLSNGLSGTKQAFALAAQGAQLLSKQLVALMANPIVAFLALVAAAIATLVKGIQSSEENMNRFNIILAPVKKALAGVQVVVETLCSGILKLAEGAGWLAGKFLEIANVATGGLFDGVIESANEAIELQEREIKLAKDQRTLTVKEAKDQLEISRLKKLATDESNKDYQTRAKQAREAADLEMGLAAERKRLAQEEYEIFKARSEWAGNTAEDYDKLAQLEAAMYMAERDYYEKTKELQGQINAIEQKAADEKKAAAEKAVETAKDAASKETEAIRAAEDAMLELVKDGAAKQRQQTENQYARDIADLKKKLKEEKNLTSTAKDAIRETIAAKEQAKEKALAEIDRQASSDAIARKQEEIDLMLAAVKEGSDAEYQLKLQQNQMAYEADCAKAEQEIADAEELQRRKLLLQQKYDAEADALSAERDAKLVEDEKLAVQNRFTERMMAAENNLLEQAQIELEQREEALNNLHQMESESDEAFYARSLEAQQAYNNSKKKVTNIENQITQSKLEVTEAVFGGISDAFEALGENNKTFAKLSKVLALAEIAINTGKALAAGIAQSQSVPFPANIAAIAATVTTITAGIVSAIATVKSAKFAKGGRVDADEFYHADGGRITGAGTGTSDSIPAMLSNGEFVMTAAATRLFEPMLTAMNNIGRGVSPQVSQPMTMSSTSPDALTESLTASIKQVRPVVSVVDINEGQNRVSVIDSLDAF